MMYAIEYIREFQKRWGNLDFKTYNRNSVGCLMLEEMQKTNESYKLNHINNFDYNLLLIDNLNTIFNDKVIIKKYNLEDMLQYIESYNISGIYCLPLDTIKESIESVNDYGESKHKVVMKNNYITAPYHIYRDAYIRHYVSMVMGDKIDDSGMPHLYHCWWNFVAMILIKLYTVDEYNNNIMFKSLEKAKVKYSRPTNRTVKQGGL